MERHIEMHPLAAWLPMMIACVQTGGCSVKRPLHVATIRTPGSVLNGIAFRSDQRRGRRTSPRVDVRSLRCPEPIQIIAFRQRKHCGQARGSCPQAPHGRPPWTRMRRNGRLPQSMAIPHAHNGTCDSTD